MDKSKLPKSQRKVLLRVVHSHESQEATSSLYGSFLRVVGFSLVFAFILAFMIVTIEELMPSFIAGWDWLRTFWFFMTLFLLFFSIFFLIFFLVFTWWKLRPLPQANQM